MCLYEKVGDVRVQFLYAGLSGKPGAGLGDPMKVKVFLIMTFAIQQGKIKGHKTRNKVM